MKVEIEYDSAETMNEFQWFMWVKKGFGKCKHVNISRYAAMRLLEGFDFKIVGTKAGYKFILL